MKMYRTDPQALLELASRVERAAICPLDEEAAAIIRSYAELVSALEWLDGPGNAFIDSTSELTVQPQRAVEIARDLGWKGLGKE